MSTYRGQDKFDTLKVAAMIFWYPVSSLTKQKEQLDSNSDGFKISHTLVFTCFF